MPRRLGFAGFWLSALGGIALVGVELLALPGARRTIAQTIPAGRTVFAGTVSDSTGAPPPAFSALMLVVPQSAGPTGAPHYCATGNADAAGNFELALLPVAPGCATPGGPLQLLVNGVPALPLVTVPPGPGIYVVSFVLGAPLSSGQPPGLGSATPTPSTLSLTIPLVRGCSQVVLTLGVGASPAQIPLYMANPRYLVAIWHFDNAQKRFSAYFPDPSVPSDLTILAPVDTVFICVLAATSITAP